MLETNSVWRHPSDVLRLQPAIGTLTTTDVHLLFTQLLKAFLAYAWATECHSILDKHLCHKGEMVFQSNTLKFQLKSMKAMVAVHYFWKINWGLVKLHRHILKVRPTVCSQTRWHRKQKRLYLNITHLKGTIFIIGLHFVLCKIQ